MIAVIGGLGAAVLWATATLCSSRSSRMLGSRVVLGWIMIVGVVVASLYYRASGARAISRLRGVGPTADSHVLTLFARASGRCLA